MTHSTSLDQLLADLPVLAVHDQPGRVAERAFRHYAAVARAPSGWLWHVWGRSLEPSLVTAFVALFVGWAFVTVLAGQG